MPRGVRRSVPKPEALASGSNTPPVKSFAISRSVESLSGDALKDHARKIGVTERDINGLSEERLRQNCLVMIHEVLDI